MRCRARQAPWLAVAVVAAAAGEAMAAYELPPVRTERGTCIPGPHHPLRVEKLPGTPVATNKKRDPLEDAHPHCAGTAAASAPNTVVR
ncbi:MAG: hypothetical protein JWQ36_1414 [Enterovirga sp.]|jgi:hypothetical protein|nr:hypothetical protein [Enterovirga sp.]